MFQRRRNNRNNKNNNNRRQRNKNPAPPQAQIVEPPPPPQLSLTLEDVTGSSSLRTCRVVKTGYLTNVPEDKVGHFYAGDTYVMFCCQEVSNFYLLKLWSPRNRDLVI